MKDIDFDKLRINAPIRDTQREQMPVPRHRKGEKFLKGPIPWGWLSHAGRLKGHALHVAIGLWFIAGIEENAIVKVSQKVMREMGVNHSTANRGLDELEKAGMIRILERGRGRTARVQLTRGGEERIGTDGQAQDR